MGEARAISTLFSQYQGEEGAGSRGEILRRAFHLLVGSQPCAPDRIRGELDALLASRAPAGDDERQLRLQLVLAVFRGGPYASDAVLGETRAGLESSGQAPALGKVRAAPLC